MEGNKFKDIRKDRRRKHRKYEWKEECGKRGMHGTKPNEVNYCKEIG